MQPALATAKGQLGKLAAAAKEMLLNKDQGDQRVGLTERVAEISAMRPERNNAWVDWVDWINWVNWVAYVPMPA